MRREAPWKKLAAELAQEGVHSHYLDRLRTRVDPESELENLQREIVGEIARALGRTEEQLHLALAELDLRAAQLARCRAEDRAAEELTRAIEAFNAQRAEAEKRLRNLVIHREAAGFRRNQELYERYPIPPRAR